MRERCWNTCITRLQVPGMCIRAETFALQDDEDDRSDDGDQIQRQVHEVAYDGRRSEPFERLLDKLAQFANRIRR